MKNNNTAKKINSSIISQLLDEISPVEKLQTNTKMRLAARIDDLITEKGWGKKEFAEKVDKNPSEITKWLSGTQNFTVDTLAEIAHVLNITVSDLFEKPDRTYAENAPQLSIELNEGQEDMQ